jgi:uncharacterized membrane protein YkoI
MNIQELKTHKKLIATILGVVVIATIGGSFAYAQTTSTGSGQTPIQGSINLPQLILSSVKTSFTTAATTAASQVTGGQVLSGGLRAIHGFEVYTFQVTNGTTVFTIIVDAGNGQVLRTSHGHPLTLSSLIGGGMGGGHRGMMYGHMGIGDPTSGNSCTARGPNVDLRGCNFSGANFSGANFRGANFSGANLSGTNFIGANLSGAYFIGANLSNADFTNANLIGIIYTGCVGTPNGTPAQGILPVC